MLDEVRNCGHAWRPGHPADTPDDDLPDGTVIDNTHRRLVLRHPTRRAAPPPAPTRTANPGEP